MLTSLSASGRLQNNMKDDLSYTTLFLFVDGCGAEHRKEFPNMQLQMMTMYNVLEDLLPSSVLNYLRDTEVLTGIQSIGSGAQKKITYDDLALRVPQEFIGQQNVVCIKMKKNDLFNLNQIANYSAMYCGQVKIGIEEVADYEKEYSVVSDIPYDIGARRVVLCAMSGDPFEWSTIDLEDLLDALKELGYLEKYFNHELNVE